MDSPDLDMTATFDALETRDAGAIVTIDADIADWARRHGYRVRTADRNGSTIYEIGPSDNEPEDPASR